MLHYIKTELMFCGFGEGCDGETSMRWDTDASCIHQRM